jgi:ATP-binding protein involved in chromosome partitioning
MSIDDGKTTGIVSQGECVPADHELSPWSNRMNDRLSAELESRIGALTMPVLGGQVDDYAKVRVSISGRTAIVELDLGFPADYVGQELVESINEAVQDDPDVDTIELRLKATVKTHGVQSQLKPLRGVANIIAVASGKGGVGKSTTAVNLALALARAGARTGILDADIYGPSQPRMLGLSGQRPESQDGKTMYPLVAYGVEAMSMGFLVDEEEPMVWRGPMVTQALNQVMTQTNWGNLDYLIVDMPPGTGDIQLTLSERVPVAGAVIVTTPQDIALLDARKGLEMFRKVSVPVLGIIENMSTHICSQCGHVESIFGEGGGQQLAKQKDVALLGQLPLDITIREQADNGRPTVINQPDGEISHAYQRCALRMTAALAAKRKDFSHKFPDIVVESS